MKKRYIFTLIFALTVLFSSAQQNNTLFFMHKVPQSNLINPDPFVEEENKIILTGILPSIRKKDANIKNMTPLDRYRTINNALTTMRGDDFKMLIKGIDELYIKSKSILFESFNTSFQVHLQISLDEIIDKYNWAQMIAGPVLSIISNSPLLLGRELWSETRIAVFQQSIDTRNTSYHLREQKPRVSFGSDWVKDSITKVPIYVERKFVQFYGMSSDTAMEKHSGGVADYRSSEGRTVRIPYRGPVEKSVFNMLGGVRSTCTYVGAKTLKELSKCTTFIRVQKQFNDVFVK